MWSEVSHSLRIVPSFLSSPSGTETALSVTDAQRGSGEISDQTCFEKTERIVGVCHGQVRHHAEGEQAAAQPFTRESPDDRTELAGRVRAKAGQRWESEGG